MSDGIASPADKTMVLFTGVIVRPCRLMLLDTFKMLVIRLDEAVIVFTAIVDPDMVDVATLFIVAFVARIVSAVIIAAGAEIFPPTERDPCRARLVPLIAAVDTAPHVTDSATVIFPPTVADNEVVINPFTVTVAPGTVVNGAPKTNVLNWPHPLHSTD